MLNPSQIGLAKLGIHIVASASVWKIVSDVVKNNVTVESGADVVKVWTGSLILGSMVADAASKHVDQKFDSFLEWVDNRAKENKPETPDTTPN